jgi:hypothetical protein
MNDFRRRRSGTTGRAVFPNRAAIANPRGPTYASIGYALVRTGLFSPDSTIPPRDRSAQAAFGPRMGDERQQEKNKDGEPKVPKSQSRPPHSLGTP